MHTGKGNSNFEKNTIMHDNLFCNSCMLSLKDMLHGMFLIQVRPLKIQTYL